MQIVGFLKNVGLPTPIVLKNVVCLSSHLDFLKKVVDILQKNGLDSQILQKKWS